MAPETRDVQAWISDTKQQMGANAGEDAADDREAALDAARKRFAMYGRQNAHVNHLVDRPAPSDGARRRRPGAQDGHDTSASTATREQHGNASVQLKNTMLLQENGELAVQLDEINYHLDGVLLDQGNDSAKADAYAHAQGVLELTRLLQVEQVQLVMKMSSNALQLSARIREVLMLLEHTDDDAFKLALAAFAYFLTLLPDCDEYIDDDVLDVIVKALQKNLVAKEEDDPAAVATASAPTTSTDANGSVLKKTALKRKKALVRKSANSQGDDGGDGHENARVAGGEEQTRTKTIHTKVTKLLVAHEAFLVDGKPQVTCVDLLGMVLHNVLQVDGRQSNLTGRSSHLYHRPQDVAGATFKVILSRKKRLIKNGGLEVLTDVLEKRHAALNATFLASMLTPATFASACSFQRIQTILRVLDQASFLSSDVQRHMSMKMPIFTILLSLVEHLGEFCWGKRALTRWKSDPTFMHLVSEVLLASLRVLINLTHHNEQAARHILELKGTSVLFHAFCLLWGTVEIASGQANVTTDGDNDEEISALSSSSTSLEEKLVFDGFLMLLSALTNCIEESSENRDVLSKISLDDHKVPGLGAFRSSSVCAVLVAFFLGRVQSYVRLIDMSESQDLEGFAQESDNMVPEDVILGGCTSLLLGCLMKESSYNSAVILGALPDGSPRLLLRSLGAFVAMHSQIGALTPEVGKSVLQVEQLLKSFLFHGGSDENLFDHLTDGVTMSSTKSSWSRESDQGEGTPRSADKCSPKGATSSPRLTSSSTNGTPQRQAPAKKFASPSPSAFKLKRTKKVCASMDDSDDDDATDACSSQSAQPSAAASEQSSTASDYRTPVTKGDKENETRAKSSQRRPTRVRRLVADLDAEFVRVNKFALLTSSDKLDDDVYGIDFSQDTITSSMDGTERGASPSTPLTRPSARSRTPASSAKKRRAPSPAAAKTPTSAVKRRKAAQPTPPPKTPKTPASLAHKRKVKAAVTPKRTPTRGVGVFDFDG
ncbi:TPA: hypothetical protein N0F65_003163 [Lagenidium giganteum]|uniref:Wings apart-like protein C-terminal domain-containing protein n=1 Tax=Lagenidium giganteum TaxID=4803 RepID=A0AAV2ZEK7_9STRA|nr:TPA: hypothetical protein N0F65_003163 [Lagenidium giganteum]